MNDSPDQDESVQRQRNQLTAQQARAIATRGTSVVLSSGAGCGKTEVLTRRYLSHLRDDGAEIGQIVAITFTDRAAREMRKRIRGAIKTELASAANGSERERCVRHLRDLETAAISTIHAFCASLLRQHAIACGLDPRFEVLEDVLSSNLRDEALTNALHLLLTEQTPVGADLRELIPIFGWTATKAAIENLLASPDIPAWDEFGGRTPDQIAIDWVNAGRLEFLREYLAHIVCAEPKIARCVELFRGTPCRGPLMAANVEKVLAGLERLADSTNLDGAVREICEAAKVGKEREKAWPDKETYEVIRDAMTDFRAALPRKLAQLIDDGDDSTAAAAVGQRFIRVAAECARAYRERKRQAAVVDFHDLLSMARDLLRDRAGVRAAVHRRFRFVLIDEFQDTDPVQMELAELLCGPGFTDGTLFVVGDPKQSIYRFRGADVGLFRRLRQRVLETGRQELSVNFRSQPRVLDFVNALFGRHIPDYEPLMASRPQANPGPCVEFLWTRREDKEFVQEARRAEAERIALRIALMIGRGEEIVVDRESKDLRPAQAEDVVLLFRSMSNVGLYEASLRKHGLDYYLVGGRAFFAQQEIYDLLNLLRALENPHDSASLAGTLRSPFGCLSDEVLYALTRHPDGLWAGLHDDDSISGLASDDRTATQRARRFLDRWRALKDRLRIARLINVILAECGYDAALQFEFLGDRKLANLWKLIDLARVFDRSGLFGLTDFIARLSELVRSQPREEQAATLPENANVIRLMSIHQAKGLEFPVVVLPDLAAKPGGTLDPVAVWDARLGCVARPPSEEGPPLFSKYGWALRQAGEEIGDWHEALRIFYVACTRAEDYLILSAALADDVPRENPAMNVLAERFDLHDGSCLDRSISAERQPSVRVIDAGATLDGGFPTRTERQKPPQLTKKDLHAVQPIWDVRPM